MLSYILLWFKIRKKNRKVQVSCYPPSYFYSNWFQCSTKLPWNFLTIVRAKTISRKYCLDSRENVHRQEIKTSALCWNRISVLSSKISNAAVISPLAETAISPIQENKRIIFNILQTSHAHHRLIVLELDRNIRSKRFRAKAHTNYALSINVV